MILSIATCILISGYSFAKYETSKKLFVKSNIAVPILEVEEGETTEINSINNIVYYEFSVRNYKQSNVSDVSQNYNLEIVSDVDEIMIYELYRDNELIELNDNKTNNIFIEGIQKQEHNYRLKISYDISNNNSQEDILGDVHIKVHSEQANI